MQIPLSPILPLQAPLATAFDHKFDKELSNMRCFFFGPIGFFKSKINNKKEHHDSVLFPTQRKTYNTVTLFAMGVYERGRGINEKRKFTGRVKVSSKFVSIESEQGVIFTLLRSFSNYESPANNYFTVVILRASRDQPAKKTQEWTLLHDFVAIKFTQRKCIF